MCFQSIPVAVGPNLRHSCLIVLAAVFPATTASLAAMISVPLSPIPEGSSSHDPDDAMSDSQQTADCSTADNATDVMPTSEVSRLALSAYGTLLPASSRLPDGETQTATPGSSSNICGT